FYITLFKETSSKLLTRMRLYGVHSSQLVHSRVVVAYLCSMGSTILLYVGVKPFLFTHIDLQSSVYVISLFALCIGIFLIGLGIIDQLCTSLSFKFTIQLLYVAICIIASGAMIPRMYFPMNVQPLLDQFFSTYTFDT